MPTDACLTKFYIPTTIMCIYTYTNKYTYIQYVQYMYVCMYIGTHLGYVKIRFTYHLVVTTLAIPYKGNMNECYTVLA